MSIVPISEQNRTVVTEISLPFLEQVIPQSVIEEILHQHQATARRQRKLSMTVIVWWVVALHLYVQTPMHEVFQKLCALWLNEDRTRQGKSPGASALVYRRYQLAIRPLVTLFHRVCQPLAGSPSEATHCQGSFLFGLRLMAIDGQVLSMPDTPQNDQYFGRSSTDRGNSAFPQAQAVYLIECGTHAVVDAGLWPYRTSEHRGARRMLRSVGPGMLVMWDRGLYSFDQFQKAHRTGAQVLCRLASTLKPSQIRVLPDGSRLVRVLPDGSRLVRVFPSDPTRRRNGDYFEARLIEYTLTDPALPGYDPKVGHGPLHRLLTTLLDDTLYPASVLVSAYHERWEIEGTADEIETHQCGPAPALRSLKPVGVLQEFYGLVIAHYVVRAWIKEAAQREGIDPDRISFTATLRLIGDMAIAFAVVPAKLWENLCQTILQG